MLRSHSRLSRELFLATFKKSKRFPGVGFQLLYSPGALFQASVVVAKKIAPLAVTRNYIRRRVYSFLREYKEKSSITGKYIVILNAESKKHSLQVLLGSLEEILKKTPYPPSH